jgi:hypothetical protein
MMLSSAFAILRPRYAMNTKTFHGSCHCQRIRFEADIDLSQGTTKCNCTSCWKRRWWSAKAKPEAFRSLGGEEHLSGYVPGQARGHTGFCKHCGVIPYGWVGAAEWNDGESVSVNVAALDDLDPAELASAPVTYCDGRNDNWWNAPAETRHL